MELKGRGGPGRGQGRKPTEEGIRSVSLTLRVTPEQKAEYDQLGGVEWFRKATGRKAKDGAVGLRHVTVNLTEEQAAKLKALGGSLWLRRMLDQEHPVDSEWIMPELLDINPEFGNQLNEILRNSPVGVLNGN